MRRALQAYSKELAELTPQIAEKEARQKKLQAKILEVGGSAYKAKKEQLDNENEQLQQLDRKITRYRTTCQNSEGTIREADKEVKAKVKEIEEAEKRIEELTATIQAHEDEAQQILEGIEACDTAKKRCRERLEESKQEFNQMKRDLQGLQE